ncbi:hydroxyproline O-galactosyltransferase GALT4 [Nematostella vectensis]|uniref:hydroxyproline O-galactosyltransferase GALT4 n=1 Tax=Nematostella vectensis TaxID=45351 RepID=UPI0013906275|nr:hydroxyproline O-galactosyltransferase GALT4 [Nematostella vectensis]
MALFKREFIFSFAITVLVGSGLLTVVWHLSLTLKNKHFVPLSQDTLRSETNSSKREETTRSTNRLKPLDLFIAIVSAPSRGVRRTAIRETWLSTIPYYPGIEARFFTDSIGLEDGIKANLTRERDQYGDLEFSPVTAGILMAHRLLWAMFWAYGRYDFKFFLRTDDDYFVCLNHLHFDIQKRKHEEFLYWGWLHCNQGVVRIDEGFLIVDNEFVRELISRNTSLVCHPYGDIAVRIWVDQFQQDRMKISFFADNPRLVHQRSGLGDHDLSADLCSKFMGIHQAYPSYMRAYWDLVKASWRNVTFPEVARQPYEVYCRWWQYDWRNMFPPYRHEPRPCWGPNSGWPELSKIKMHEGREK